VGSLALGLHTYRKYGHDAMTSRVSIGWLALLSATSGADIGTTVSWQAHSFNDCRQWPQLFAKGAKFMKIDPQYAPAAFCANQARANGTDYARGCLLLNHDSVTMMRHRDTYNTTGDAIAFVTDPAHAAWFANPDPAAKVTFTLCFKGCGGAPKCPCDASEATADWLALADAFVADANAAVADHGLNVEWVLDGALPFIPLHALQLCNCALPRATAHCTVDQPACAHHTPRHRQRQPGRGGRRVPRATMAAVGECLH